MKKQFLPQLKNPSVWMCLATAGNLLLGGCNEVSFSLTPENSRKVASAGSPNADTNGSTNTTGNTVNTGGSGSGSTGGGGGAGDTGGGGSPDWNNPGSGGGTTSLGGAGNVVIYGDEWVARFYDDATSPTWNSPSTASGVTMKNNLTNFWQDSFKVITSSSKSQVKKILFARFNSAASTWRVAPISDWSTYIPMVNFGNTYTLVDHPVGATLSRSVLLDSNNVPLYDALIFVSTDPTNLLSATDLADYVAAGGGLMTMLVGIPGSSECSKMNALLACSSTYYDCSTTMNEFQFVGPFSNVSPYSMATHPFNATSSFPFNNGNGIKANSNISCSSHF